MTTCVVHVAYIEPSVRHVPWRLPVAGGPALGLLLQRLTAGCGRDRARVILCADPHRADDVRAIGEAYGWPVCSPGASAVTLTTVLSALADGEPETRDFALFSGNDIVPDAEACERLIERHHEAGAEATVAADPLLDGLVPLVLESTVVKELAARHPEVRDVRWLAAVLRSSGDDPRICRVPTEALAAETVAAAWPAAPGIEDRWTQDAADAAALAASDREACRVFRTRLLATEHVVPPLKPIPPVSSGSDRSARVVLFASMRQAFTGAENSLFALISSLDPDRYHPVALFPFESKLAEKVRSAGVETLVAGWDYADFTARNVNYCQAVLDTYRPEIVHVDLVPSPALMVMARARGIRLVGHVRTAPEGRLSPFVFMPDKLIAVSDMVARRLRRYHLPPDRVVTVYNGVLAEDVNNRENADDTANEKDGVELRRAQRRAYGIPDDAFVVTIVARLAPDKKIHTFLDAMSRVIAERPEAWALVVGEASAADLGYRRTIQAMTAGQPLEQRTTWMAFEENIQKVFSVTDIVALCATNEPFPRSVLEGLASGVPAIVPDTGGSTELVEHGQSGLFFRSDSPEDLAAAVLRVIGDGDLRTKLARQSRDRARRFDVRHHVRAVQAVYDELAGTVYTS